MILMCDHAGRAHPFLKWAGGKGQLLAAIRKYYPFADSRFTRYVEPFVGGGAVLFDVLSQYNLLEAYINDVNCELVNAYYVLKHKVEELLPLLEEYQRQYWGIPLEERSNFYNEKRNLYNLKKTAGYVRGDVEVAALLIFLNKTCFNGLYRVNAKGMFNVPAGRYKNPLICDKENLRTLAVLLQNVTIQCGDYSKMASYVDEHTFVYIDPPYRPLSASSSFTSYAAHAFTDSDQRDLSEFAKLLRAKGARVLISNSDPKNVDSNDSFFDDLYDSFAIERVFATRMINSKSSSRGKISELLISSVWF